jgi:hypothetical protein
VRETFTGSGTSGGFGGAVSRIGPLGLEISANLLDQNLPALNFKTGEDVGEWTTALSEKLFINEKQESPQKQAKSS